MEFAWELEVVEAVGVEDQGMRMPDLEQLQPVVVRIQQEEAGRHTPVQERNNILATADNMVYTRDTGTADSMVYNMVPNICGGIRTELFEHDRLPEMGYRRACHTFRTCHGPPVCHYVNNLQWVQGIVSKK